MRQSGLAHAWKVFYEQMPTGYHAAQSKSDLPVLAQQHLADLIDGRLNSVLHVVPCSAIFLLDLRVKPSGLPPCVQRWGDLSVS